ncbi:heat shock protein GrpE [compost metagenome]
MAYLPAELKDNKWAQGIAGLVKNLEKSLEGLNLKRIDAKEGADFNPDLHEAIQFDEDAEGDKEVVAEELQAGYTLSGQPIRHAMVKVTKKK